MAQGVRIRAEPLGKGPFPCGGLGNQRPCAQGVQPPGDIQQPSAGIHAAAGDHRMAADGLQMRRNGPAQQGRIRAGQAGANLLPGQETPALVQRQQRERVRRPAVAQPFPAGAPDHRPGRSGCSGIPSGRGRRPLRSAGRARQGWLPQGFGAGAAAHPPGRGTGANGSGTADPGRSSQGGNRPWRRSRTGTGRENGHPADPAGRRQAGQGPVQAWEPPEGKHGGSLCETIRRRPGDFLRKCTANPAATVDTHFHCVVYLSCVPLDGAPVAKKGLL